jgi:hypothetical protein
MNYSLRILFDAVGQFKIALRDLKNKNTEGVICFIMDSYSYKLVTKLKTPQDLRPQFNNGSTYINA